MSSNYKHRRKEWLGFRERCLKAGGHVCERCGATGILQVHHPEYGKGREPWEYEVRFCEVLCRRCHAEEHGIIPPQSGWTLLYSDLENNGPSNEIPCAHCGRSIRWHFTIYHPHWGEWVVGSDCAENLSLGPEVRSLKSFHRRYNTFAGSPRWREQYNRWKIKQDGYDCVIQHFSEIYKIEIDNKQGKGSYQNLEDAKMRLFEVLEARRSRLIEKIEKEIHSL